MDCRATVFRSHYAAGHAERYYPRKSPLWVILPSKLAVTDAGLVVAARFILRAAVCVSIVALLTATTQRVKLFRGLRMLGVPQIFVTLLSMMERYIGVLVICAEEIHLAKISRSIAPGAFVRKKPGPRLGWVLCFADHTRWATRYIWRWCPAATPERFTASKSLFCVQRTGRSCWLPRYCVRSCFILGDI